MENIFALEATRIIQEELLNNAIYVLCCFKCRQLLNTNSTTVFDVIYAKLIAY